MASVTRPPGPKGHFLLGVLPEAREEDVKFATRMAREYGDIVFFRVVNIPTYLISRPSYIEEVLVTNYRNFIKAVYLRESRGLFGEGLLTSDGDTWVRERRIGQRAFRHEHIDTYADTVVRFTGRKLDQWQDGETRDVHQEMMRLTLEIIARVLFGRELADELEGAEAAISVYLDQFASRFGLYAVPEWIPTPGNLRYRRAMRRLDGIIYDAIRDGRSSNGHANEGERSLLAAFLHAQEHYGIRMTDPQLRDEMATLFFTGHETTGLALTWTLFLLGENPAAESRLVEELEGALGDRPATLADLRRLRYLDCVIKESLRLYPPAYAVVREALNECEIGGYRIPKGSTVAMFQWVVHRDPRFYDDPDAFRPERWEDGLSDRLPKFAYFPFGGGPRNCIGRDFAQLEIAMILATIMRRFRFRTLKGHRTWPLPSLTLRPEYGMKMVLHSQQNVAAS
ncbi:MAG TPA: cytochrome P450 [Terriglobia bacterium]|jgi:cytochrome P450|nr:cytochrome P450 [Terriglobia bacterium]